MLPRRNILIFHSAALGDFILTWPLALALTRLYPQSRVIYVTQKQKGLLAESALGVESLDSESGWHRLYASPPELPAEIAAVLASTRQIFTFIAAPNDFWSTNVAAAVQSATAQSAASPASPDTTEPLALVHLPTKPPPDHAAPHSDFLAAALAAQPVVQSAFTQLLAVIAQRGLAPGRVVGDQIIIHPGAGSPDKCWPADRYLELVRRLRAANRRVAVVVGEVENDKIPPDQLAAFEREAQLLRPQSYVELHNLLRDARGFIGNDSGPTHLAAILGIPTIALFGPTNPIIWKPLGPTVTVLQEPVLTNLRVDRAYEAVTAVM